MAEIGNPKYLEHRGKTTSGVVSLHSRAGVPNQMGLVVPQPFSQRHVLGQKVDVLESAPPQRLGDVQRGAFLILGPERNVVRKQNGSGAIAVTPMDDRNVQFVTEPIDQRRELAEVVTIPRAFRRLRCFGLLLEHAPPLRVSRC